MKAAGVSEDKDNDCCHCHPMPSPPSRFRRQFKWLTPGLFVKRWLMLSAIGVVCVGFGVAISIRLTPVFFLLQLLEKALQTLTKTVPRYISGPFVLALGIFLIWWGQSRTLGAITEALLPEGDNVLDKLLTHRRLNRGPKLVALGGGTGLSTLLRGLKDYSTNITAIVTVADDGGSSGRLRREMGVLPPGDVRNCLAALADEENLITELLQHRFSSGDGLTGHSFGNLFLTAMTEITGDLEQAIAASSKVLAIRGDVLPATLSDVRLWAEFADGRRVEGESKIPEVGGKIVKIGCIPEDPPALPKAVRAIQTADLIILGPGSLYTSIIPNLLVSEIVAAITARQVACVYVCNVMTQPGETDYFSVADHVRAIDRVCGQRLFDAVLVQKDSPSEMSLERYAARKSYPVVLDRDELRRIRCRPILANIVDEDPETHLIRHNSQKLARILLRWHARIQGLQAKQNSTKI
jgi:uncharacterized cofD-like protein